MCWQCILRDLNCFLIAHIWQRKALDVSHRPCMRAITPFPSQPMTWYHILDFDAAKRPFSAVSVSTHIIEGGQVLFQDMHAWSSWSWRLIPLNPKAEIYVELLSLVSTKPHNMGCSLSSTQSDTLFLQFYTPTSLTGCMGWLIPDGKNYRSYCGSRSGTQQLVDTHPLNLINLGFQAKYTSWSRMRYLELGARLLCLFDISISSSLKLLQWEARCHLNSRSPRFSSGRVRVTRGFGLWTRRKPNPKRRRRVYPRKTQIWKS